MRIIGTVTVNGVRMPLDWRIRGTSIEAGPGVSADGVTLLVPLPSFTTESGTAYVTEEEVEQTPVEPVAPSYEEMTVTDLRVILEQRGLPVSGVKTELIQRLVDDDAAQAEPVAEVEVSEDVEEV